MHIHSSSIHPWGGSCTDPARCQHALLCSKRKVDESEEEENEENQTSNSSGRRPKRDKTGRKKDEDDADGEDDSDDEPERPPPPSSPYDYADLACSWYEDGGGLSFGGTKRFMNTAQYKAVYNFLHFFCISIVTLLIAQNIILLPVGILFGAINYSDKLLSINDGNPHGECDD